MPKKKTFKFSEHATTRGRPKSEAAIYVKTSTDKKPDTNWESVKVAIRNDIIQLCGWKAGDKIGLDVSDDVGSLYLDETGRKLSIPYGGKDGRGYIVYRIPCGALPKYDGEALDVEVGNKSVCFDMPKEREAVK